jgi:NADPH:quinone reductase-like Zn-dependent oxidoreductase
MLSYDVVQWGKPLEKIERATPVPMGTEVLVKLRYCGVCHSDVHIRDGYFDLGGGRRLPMSERGMVPPVTLGMNRTERSSLPDRMPAPFPSAQIV